VIKIKIGKMYRKIIGSAVMIGVLAYSCNNSGEQTTSSKNEPAKNEILQQSDGTISLKVEKADCYQDKTNPASNTAEWSVFVSKSGRFDVWMSSATKDTTDLKYDNSVKLSILDNRIEAVPACDRIVRNSGDVAYPLFRADSFLGSLYIQDTGLYNVQMISEKILTKDGKKDLDNSEVLSVFLKPSTR
jgi:hypothetical protein